MRNYQATTPEHFFKFDDVSIIDELLITYYQNRKIILEKRKRDLTFVGNTGGFQLTQQEMSMFDVGKARVQVRMKDTSGYVFCSKQMEFNVELAFDKEVL